MNHIIRQIICILYVACIAAIPISYAFRSKEDPKMEEIAIAQKDSNYNAVGGVDNMTYESLIDSAENNASHNKWNKAANLYREALRKNPSSPLNSKLFANLGICLSRQGLYEDALEALSIALIKEPGSTKILLARAGTLLEIKNFSGAIADIGEVLTLDSLNSEALRMHGLLMLLQNEDEKALEDFRKLQKAYPDDEWGYAGTAEVLTRMGKYQEAIPLFSKALSLKESTDFRISYISSLLIENRLADAESAIRESFAIYPQAGEFYLLRAVLYKKLHQNNDAERDIRYAIDYGIDPQMIEKFTHSFEK